MPELPEVETVVRHLRRAVSGARIVGAWCDTPNILRGTSIAAFTRAIRGARIESVERRGKNILIGLSGDRLLLVHQKMTGHFLIGKWRIGMSSAGRSRAKTVVKDGPLTESVNQFIHLIFRLEDGRMLGLSDLRKFAKVLLGRREEILALPELRKLGPDPFDRRLTPGVFAARAGKGKRKIKQVLLDQNVIAGIGNIYGDDILWRARISPFRPANRVSAKGYAEILKQTRNILRRSIRLRGASVSDFRDPSGESGGYGPVRLAYQRHGTPCPRCGHMFERKTIGSRSAHFCPKCQK